MQPDLFRHESPRPDAGARAADRPSERQETGLRTVVTVNEGWDLLADHLGCARATAKKVYSGYLPVRVDTAGKRRRRYCFRDEVLAMVRRLQRATVIE